MNTMTQKKRVPGIVGLFVLILGIGVTVILAGTQTNWFQHAAPPQDPVDIRITNITDSSFTLTYKTDAAYIGTMSLTQDADTQTILDDRDQKSGTPHQYSLHSITVRNLQAATQYNFSILSGTTTYLNNGQKFTITTAPKLTDPPTKTDPLAGKIIGVDGQTPQESLVYMTTDNGQTLSTLVDESGLYIIPLNLLRTKDLSALLPLDQTGQMQVLAIDPNTSAHAIVSVAGSNPVPAITLGQDYDFTISSTPIASSSATGGFPEFALDETLRATPQILTPATPNQGFTDAQPLFKGTALPNQSVTITIHSTDVITKTVTTDANGNWSFRPDQPLSEGKHTITISTTNKAGIIQTIQKSFTVYAAGSQVDQSTTPVPTGAALTQAPNPSPTSKPAGKPTATPTPKPKVTATPTPKPSPTIQPSITSTVTATPTTIPPHPTKLPPTGSNATVTLGITGIVTTLVGMIIFLLTRGAVL